MPQRYLLCFSQTSNSRLKRLKWGKGMLTPCMSSPLSALFPDFPSGAVSLPLNVFTHNKMSPLCVSVKDSTEHEGDSFPCSREDVLCWFLAGIVSEEALLSFSMFLYLMCHFFFKSLFQDFLFIFSVVSFCCFVLFSFLFFVHHASWICLSVVFNYTGEIFFAHLSFFLSSRSSPTCIWVFGSLGQMIVSFLGFLCGISLLCCRFSLVSIVLSPSQS